MYLLLLTNNLGHEVLSAEINTLIIVFRGKSSDLTIFMSPSFAAFNIPSDDFSTRLLEIYLHSLVNGKNTVLVVMKFMNT